MGQNGAFLCIFGKWSYHSFYGIKTLNWLYPKNHFYRANRELGRVFKTENILTYMSTPYCGKTGDAVY